MRRTLPDLSRVVLQETRGIILMIQVSSGIMTNNGDGSSKKENRPFNRTVLVPVIKHGGIDLVLI